MIDLGSIKEVDFPTKTELVGKAFENLSVFEKDLGDGQIYVTEPVTEQVDRTMAMFLFFRAYAVAGGDSLKVYEVRYLDPRTVPDSSLLHALFVANPAVTEARVRVFELFLIEYALERGQIEDLEDVLRWACSKGYSLPPKPQLQSVIEHSSYFTQRPGTCDLVFVISADQEQFIQDCRAEFGMSRDRCVERVKESICRVTGSERAAEGIPMQSLVEDYLCAVFSEIRLMANYFRHNNQMFHEGREKFEKFDYILKRALPGWGKKHFGEWKAGFLAGLRDEAHAGNPFIAAVFHNVLATYYLNRSTQASPYQIDKLRSRELHLDTNVLYAFLVKASSYNEIVSYIIGQLAQLGVMAKVYPFTIAEYEQSLESVERHYHDGKPSLHLLERNPWILQELRTNPGKYMDRMAVYRRLHSIAKDCPIDEDHFSGLDNRLQELGLQLETQFSTYHDDEVSELWVSFRNLVPSGSWDNARFWDFIYQDALRSEDLKRHDVHCLQNLIDKSAHETRDELGAKTLFLTLDSRRLLRLRKKYPFIVSPEQFLEFFLPYLFLADVPVREAQGFPNKLLAAGLGTIMVGRPPQVVEMLRAFLEDPSLLESPDRILSESGREIAIALNSERFREVAELYPDLPDSQKLDTARRIADILESDRRVHSGRFHKDRIDQSDRLSEKDREIEKLRRTVRYWRSQARKRSEE